MTKSMGAEINTAEAVKAQGDTPAPALLFEMARSFVALAETLNLSHAVEKLNSTRQTLRRHISNLEEAMGEPLFVVEDRRYNLTDAGKRALLPAQSIIAQGETWHSGQYFAVDGLNQLSFADPSGWFFHQSQRPISDIWQGKSELLKTALRAWTQSQGELESEEMSVVRPYMLVYRESAVGWICVEVGERSFYSNWWGWAKARSSIGQALENFPGGEQVANLMGVPYREVKATHGMRLDQVVSAMPREDGGPLITIAFERLVLGGYLPDGSFALLVVVDRPDNISISGIEPTILDTVPADAGVNFDENVSI